MNDASQKQRLTQDTVDSSGATGQALPPPSFRRGGRVVRRVLALLVALGLLAGLAYWLYGRWTTVTIYDARIAADVISIASRVDGWITAVEVEEAQQVHRGQVLVTVDSRESQLRLKELESEIASLFAERDRLDAEIVMTERQSASQIAASEANLKAAGAALKARESELAQARSDLERADSLVERAVVSRQRWENARTLYSQAQQRHLAAQAEVSRAEAAVSQAEAERARVEVMRRRQAALAHDVATLQARRDRQQLDMADRAIKAPTAGIVDRIFVDPGEYVAPGQRLMLLHDPQQIWVSANVKETDIRNLRIGSSARITVDAYPHIKVTGEVVRLGHAATSQFALLPNPNPSGNFTKITQRLPVKIAVDQVDGLLRPGMMVEVSIAIQRD